MYTVRLSDYLWVIMDNCIGSLTLDGCFQTLRWLGCNYVRPVATASVSDKWLVFMRTVSRVYVVIGAKKVKEKIGRRRLLSNWVQWYLRKVKNSYDCFHIYYIHPTMHTSLNS